MARLAIAIPQCHLIRVVHLAVTPASTLLAISHVTVLGISNQPHALNSLVCVQFRRLSMVGLATATRHYNMDRPVYPLVITATYLLALFRATALGISRSQHA